MNFPRPASLIGSGIGSGNELGANEGLKTGLRRGLASDTKNHSTNEIKNDLKNESKTDLRSDSKSASTNDVRENKNHQERLERFENTERVENGDAVTEELKRWRTYALIFACSILSLLIFIAVAGNRPRREIFNRLGMGSGRNPNPDTYSSEGSSSHSPATSEVGTQFAHRMESQHLSDELMQTFALHPRVAKHVFSRILSEDGIELTAKYLHIFGENVVIEILHDSSLQQEMNALLDYYGRTPIEIQAPEKLDLLRKLQQLTVAGKLAVIGNRSSNLFDFLSEMDAVQTYELVRKESLTVKAIVLTQCDAQKRSSVYNQLDENTQMLLLSELTRIDYLPRDYIANVANALKRKRRENPRLNTDALPGSEVLVTLLERSGPETTRGVIRNLEANSPDSARNVKAKLISLDTLCYLRDGQLLEVVLALKHDELLQFLKGAPTHIREDVFAKCPRELAIDLQDELVSLEPVSRETFATVERKIINRMKTMANAGMINLAETNDRMFGMSESRDASKQGDGGNMGMSTLQHRSFTNSKAAG